MNFQELLTFCRGKNRSHGPVLLILLGIIVFVLPINAQQVSTDSTQSRIDSLNIRRLSPSFLLWQNMRTNPLYPFRNPFLQQRSPFLPVSPVQQDVQVLIDSTLRYNIVDQLDTTRFGNQQEYDFEQFSEIQQYRVRQDYWRSRARGMDGESAVEGRSLIPH